MSAPSSPKAAAPRALASPAQPASPAQQAASPGLARGSPMAAGAAAAKAAASAGLGKSASSASGASSASSASAAPAEKGKGGATQRPSGPAASAVSAVSAGGAGGKRKNAPLEPAELERRRAKLLQASIEASEATKLKFGMFHEQVPTCVGDPFDDPVPVSRTFARGKPNFKGGKPRFSQDGCFTPLLTTTCIDEGGAGKPGKSTRRRSKVQPAALAPFHGGGQQGRLPDTIYSLITTDRHMGKDEVKAALSATRQAELERDKERILRARSGIKQGLKNITTTPMKKGSYGTPGVLLSEIYLTQPVPGAGKSAADSKVAAEKAANLADQADKLAGARAAPGAKPAATKQQQQAKHKARQQAKELGPPFCSTTKVQSRPFSKDDEVFIHKPICASRVVERKRDVPARDLPPFRPGGNTNKQPHVDYPIYMPFTREEADKVAKDKNKDVECWKPASSLKTHPVRSIQFNPVVLKSIMRAEAKLR